jgi:hypothetical protein
VGIRPLEHHYPSPTLLAWWNVIPSTQTTIFCWRSHSPGALSTGDTPLPQSLSPGFLPLGFGARTPSLSSRSGGGQSGGRDTTSAQKAVGHGRTQRRSGPSHVGLVWKKPPSFSYLQHLPSELMFSTTNPCFLGSLLQLQGRIKILLVLEQVQCFHECVSNSTLVH